METVVRKLHILGLFVFLSLSSAGACPKIRGLIDFNCDRKIQIVGIGDSIVYGVGDEDYDGKGGYMTRLRSVFPKTNIYKEGFPGITVARLLGFYKTLFRRAPNNPLIKKIGNADILLIDVGRNDYFNRNPSSLTVDTLRIMTEYLTRKLKKKFKTVPLIVGAELIPSAREFDMDFINAINSSLFMKRSGSFPFYLRFDLLDPLLLGEDGIHPTSGGYAQMTEFAAEYIRDDAQVRSEAERIDRDNDGIYDIFEKSKFGTNPRVADTDGDGILDGDEVFVFRTDPMVPNSSGKDETGEDRQGDQLVP